MALASAEILGKAPGNTSHVSEALRYHEERLRPSTEPLQAASRKLAAWYIPKGTFAYHIWNFLLKITPYYSWLVSFHVNSLRSEIELT
ncbi:uncharacterized protein A1O9_07875 [Exophiala aquamarina CBS 119918]|uniref:FAD-binding domain-containing protein n=1 Tax=Exophiala aquamarina CBS 119918 TaxID=1182545 RepID=A0A072P899_9EURO|nr:uncharacterized protein A1O9_07875 [Exophiala aquamarina CBS 119918]KEF56294.1 hypothetical protein A1O9_07875 [Exophiala aquamarina CBS 119918]